MSRQRPTHGHACGGDDDDDDDEARFGKADTLLFIRPYTSLSAWKGEEEKAERMK